MRPKIRSVVPLRIRKDSQFVLFPGFGDQCQAGRSFATAHAPISFASSFKSRQTVKSDRFYSQLASQHTMVLDQAVSLDGKQSVAKQPYEGLNAQDLPFYVGDLDGALLSKETPQFIVGNKNGFLPREHPLIELPAPFGIVNEILDDMPITKKDGQPGLLAKGLFGSAVLEKLPNLVAHIEPITDSHLLSALYRDYTFLASSYLLEPCDIQYRKDKTYGLGRDRLPASIAQPLCRVAEKIGAKPFMEYAMSYALYNYRLVDPQVPLQYSNLALIRAFEGSPAEHGFILVHVAMVAHSGRQVKHTMAILDAAEKKDRAAFDAALLEHHRALSDINSVMESMWKRSSSAAYDNFRTFIMGTKNQPMFPNGVVYEGVSEEPQFYRGESGANDSMIPTADNLFQLTKVMPKNPLTDILKDFRSYRPPHHNAWLSYIEGRANSVNVKEFALESPESTVYYLSNLDLIREFRARHWNFTKEYILKYSNHPVATGGSPIVTWLPNQLSAVLEAMHAVASTVDPNGPLLAHRPDLQETLLTLRERADTQKRILEREVQDLAKKYGKQATEPTLSC